MNISHEQMSLWWQETLGVFLSTVSGMASCQNCSRAPVKLHCTRGHFRAFIMAYMALTGVYSLGNRERHTEVRLRSDTAPSCWAALARCGRSGHVQAWLDGIQVSSRPTARLLVWAVHAGRSSRWMTASLFSQLQLARRPKVPAEHVWPSCLCRGCASNLELTVEWTAKPGSPQCHLPTQLKDVSVSTIPGALSALEALCDYALYKSTFTFTLKTVTKINWGDEYCTSFHWQSSLDCYILCIKF